MERPLTRLEDLRQRGFLVQDLLAVALGLKPLCRSGLTREDQPTLKPLRSFAKKTGLHLKLYRSLYEPGPMFMIAGQASALKAFEAAVLAKASATTARDTAAATRKMGRILGYPPCCVEAFTLSEPGGNSWSFPRELSKRYDGAPIPFTMNFLHNFHSRSSSPKKELQRMLKAGYRSMELYLLPWIPCRWDCPASLAYAQRLHQELDKRLPAFARALRECLSMPVLFFDDWKFIPLMGARLQGARLAYALPLDAKTLVPARVMSLLRRGDALKESARAIQVLRQGRIIGRLTEDCLLFRFQ